MKHTQGEQIASHLKLRPHTYMEMLGLGISVAPWRRVDEWLRINPDWRLVKGKKYLGEGKYATTWKLSRERTEPALWRPRIG